MKIKAIGRQLLVKLDTDHIMDAVKSKLIELPKETLEKSKGGSQIFTVLDVGRTAFADENPEVYETIVPGRQVITSRYPGHSIDLDLYSSDHELHTLRMISSDEVHALVALTEEEGADV